MIGMVGLVLLYGVWMAWWMWSHMRPKAVAEERDWQLKNKKRKRQNRGGGDSV